MNITKGTLRRNYKRQAESVKKELSFRAWARKNAEELVAKYSELDREFSDEVLKLFGVE